VAANTKTDYWLFEGFAKYSEIIALEKVLGKGVEKRALPG